MYVSVFAHARPSLKLLCSSIPLWYLQKNRSYVQCTDDHLKYLLALRLQMEMVPFSFLFFTIRSYNHPSGAHLFKDGNESGQGRFFAGLSKSVTHLCMEDFLHVAVPDLICFF
jgi:hypothetical protein